MQYNNNIRMVDSSLVNKILEQGQKLRNAMVGSILKNDPFNTDIIYSKQFNTPITSSSELNDFKSIGPLTTLDEKRLEAYIKGEYMSKDEEKLALDTLRSMSAPDLFKTTERTLNSPCSSNCKCYTCEVYNTNLYCDLRRKNKDVDSDKQYTVSDVTKDIQEKYKIENKHLLEYADSLKVSINSFTLSETGNLKVSDNDKKVPYNFSQTYFLEYNLPDCIVSKCPVSKSKVNSGLENNYVRFCSRRSNDVIYFKQTTIHDVRNLNKYNLDEYEIKFKISYRTQKQKHPCTLGFAKFQLASFLLSKNLVCNQNLPVFLTENSPISVGSLKVSLLLGCGRLYFGQEFIDAIHFSVNKNPVVLDSDDSTNLLNEVTNYNTKPINDDGRSQTYKNKRIAEENKEQKHITGEIAVNNSAFKQHKKPQTNLKSVVPKSPKEIRKKEDHKTHIESVNKKENFRTDCKHTKNEQKVNSVVEQKLLKPQISENEKQILFGFIYISQAQYLSPPVNTYITCRPFCQSETSCSRLITDTSNPIFNFSQLIPLIYEDELLQLFRENYMIIEFWKKIDSTDIVVGLTKISLHQFYLAYRNPVFVKYLSKNKLPIIDTDWWEPIYSVDNSEDILGQVQILVALGTEEQVNNLKSERGFTNGIVKAKFASPHFLSKYETKVPEKSNIRELYSVYKSRHVNDIRNFLHKKGEGKFKHISERSFNSNISGETSPRLLSKVEKKNISSNFVDKSVNTSLSPKVNSTTTRKFDVGIQSDLEMDKTQDVQNKEKVSPTQEMLGNFLNQMMAQRQRNVFVENSTNTEAAAESIGCNCNQSLQEAQQNTNLKLRKTTDLLDSLQKALSLDSIPNNPPQTEKKPGVFRASVAINSANHLPSRKKCKSKKSRNRSVKNDDSGLPSCYVTFETSENDLKLTPVISKTTNPTWNFKCEANLSEDLLTNSQRRLIFKVWRKATNTVLTPNLQTDVVLGFAAVDLTVLLAGFPNVQGWFNIIDFTGKCNGQINIHITPLENLSKFNSRKDECNCNISAENSKPDAVKPDDEPSELFSRALKRKFTELDEITQRLRLRLSKVTNDDSDSSDGVVDEFEKDINTLCVEEDFDLIDFDVEARKLNFNYNKENATSSTESSTSKLQSLLAVKEKGCDEDETMRIADESKTSSSNTTTSLSQDLGSILELGHSSDKEKELTTLDKHLQEGKQKIDSLLEKLSLISADTDNTFASRYVSGCSLSNDYNAINIDTEAILKELDHSSRPNIQLSLGFEPLKFQQLYGTSFDSKNSGSSTSHTSNSDTSLITNFSESRQAPDGQGNVSDIKVVKK